MIASWVFTLILVGYHSCSAIDCVTEIDFVVEYTCNRSIVPTVYIGCVGDCSVTFQPVYRKRVAVQINRVVDGEP